jgi:membrane-associated phospholipid phosphatase
MLVGVIIEGNRRVRALFWNKVGLTIGINILFWGGYGWLSRHAVFPVRPMILTWFDAAVPFVPEPWAGIYLSQFLLTGGLPWLIDSIDVLRRYVRALVGLSMVSFLIFLVWPVASPRSLLQPDSGLMAWITRMDGIYNAFPSLHAGFLVLMGGLLCRMFGRRPPVFVMVLFATWAVAILFSTLATRQHYFMDLAAGVVLGRLADHYAWRKFKQDDPARSQTPA